MNKNIPLISVVMSIYNGEKYIRKSINSIINQTLSDFEILIVNDGSTDKTLSLLKEYKKIDQRIKIINQQTNLGLTKSLNNAINLAKGKYIARHDVDEFSRKERFEKLMKLFSDKKVVVVGSNCVNVYPNGTKTFWGFFSENSIKRTIKYKTPFPHGSAIFIRNIFEKVGCYNTRYETCQDFDLWIKFSKFGKLVMSKEMLIYRYVGNESISQTRKLRQSYDSFLIRWNHNKGIRKIFTIIYSIYYSTILLLPKKILFVFAKSNKNDFNL